MIRRIVALVILHALLSNPERHKYISKLSEEGKYSNRELTEKNINKAYIMADQFLEDKWK